jgi:hypothetical protein
MTFWNQFIITFKTLKSFYFARILLFDVLKEDFKLSSSAYSKLVLFMSLRARKLQIDLKSNFFSDLRND